MPKLFDIAGPAAGVGAIAGYADIVAVANYPITLRASAATAVTAEASALTTAVTGLGGYRQAMILFDLTAAGTEAGDTLDVYVDTSPDGGTTYVNVVHFNQVLGNGGTKQFWAVLDPGGAPGTATVAVSTDAAAAVVRPAMFCDNLRVRYTTVDAVTTGNLAFTFSVKAFMKA